MERTWANLTKLLTWAAQHGSEASIADTAGETIVIDGTITKEDLDRFKASQSDPRHLPLAMEEDRKGPTHGEV